MTDNTGDDWDDAGQWATDVDAVDGWIAETSVAVQDEQASKQRRLEDLDSFRADLLAHAARNSQQPDDITISPRAAATVTTPPPGPLILTRLLGVHITAVLSFLPFHDCLQLMLHVSQSATVTWQSAQMPRRYENQASVIHRLRYMDDPFIDGTRAAWRHRLFAARSTTFVGMAAAPEAQVSKKDMSVYFPALTRCTTRQAPCVRRVQLHLYELSLPQLRSIRHAFPGMRELYITLARSWRNLGVGARMAARVELEPMQLLKWITADCIACGRLRLVEVQHDFTVSPAFVQHWQRQMALAFDEHGVIVSVGLATL